MYQKLINDLMELIAKEKDGERKLKQLYGAADRLYVTGHIEPQPRCTQKTTP